MLPLDGGVTLRDTAVTLLGCLHVVFCRELLQTSLAQLQADVQEKAEAFKAEGGDPDAVFVRCEQVLCIVMADPVRLSGVAARPIRT
jgi:hypothetical protein